MEREPGGSSADPFIAETLDREIGLMGATSLGVGTMVAAGIFILSGLAVGNVGAMAITSFLIAAVVASFTAFAYAEFSAIYPESGGGYAYVSNVFDSDLTYIVGWSMILGYPASAAFYLASFSDWFYRFMYPALDIPEAVPYWFSGVMVLALLIGVNLKGTKETGFFQLVVTGMKIALILLFIFGGLQAFDAETVASSFAENAGDLRQIGLTSALVFITFFGFEAIGTNAEEIEKPHKNVPRAIFISMGLVTVLYVLVVLVIVLAIHDEAFLHFLIDRTSVASLEGARSFVTRNGEVAMGRAAQYYIGDFGFFVIIVGALLSMLSAANATVFAGSRVKLAMGRRDHLPSTLGDLHPNFETPYKSVLLTGVFIFFFISFFTVLFGGVPGAEGPALGFRGLYLGIEAVAHFADFMLLGGLIFVNLAVIYSRKRHPGIERPFRVPGVPLVPLLAVAANLLLLVNVEPKSFILGLTAEAVGIALWFAWKSRAPSEKIVEEKTPTAVTRSRSTGGGYQIAVAISNPPNLYQLMRTACILAKDRGGEVLVVHAVTMPEQTPLSEGHEIAERRRGILNEAIEFSEGRGVPASGIIRIGHHASHAILNTLEQEGSDAVLLGWEGGSGGQEAVLGSNVDRVVSKAKCDVHVEKIWPNAGGEIGSVLLPVAGGPHFDLSAETARAIARAKDSSVKLLHVLGTNPSVEDRGGAEEFLKSAEGKFEDVRTELEVVENDDVVAAIVEESGRHGVTVIGASREGFLQKVLFGTAPELVARQAGSIVIMNKRYLGVKSRLKGLVKELILRRHAG